MLTALIRRNVALMLKDKGSLFAIFMTPMILLVLFITFLRGVYRDTFLSIVPQGLSISDRIIDGGVGGYLLSSLLATCCVTVAFMANMMIVHDKVTGARKDLAMTPAKPTTIALGYYLAAGITSLLICLLALGAGLIYLGAVGWYLTLGDLAGILLDMVILILFGTGLSSILYRFLSTQGQMTAVSAIVSAVYGFLCGAYMPISSFGAGLQHFLHFLPGTYGTVLLRQHAIGSVLTEMEEAGIPAQAVDGLRQGIDCELEFFGHLVSTPVLYLVLVAATVLFTGVYAVLCVREKRG